MSRILIVDDEKHVVDGLKRILHSQGCPHICDGVTSAVEALRRIDEATYDAIISDVSMPGVDGVEFLARLKGNPEGRHIPVIMLTGHTDAAARRTALQLGAYDFISKPADPAELMARLDNAIRLKDYQDRLRRQNDIMERQLMQAQKMEVVGLLASGIVHDLNNILAGIVGHTELAAIQAGDDTPIQKNLKNALESADHATKLVQQILALGRAPSHAAVESDLGVEVNDSMRLLGAVIPSAVQIEWTPPDTQYTVPIEPTQVHQIVMNLCTNAVHAMNGQGCLRVAVASVDVDLETSATIELPGPGTYAVLTIGDNGCGMDEDTVGKIFDPFFTTKPVGKGTGIGLSVVRRILEHQGGAITVQSTPREGTTFQVYLPQRDVELPTEEHVDEGELHVGPKAHSLCR